MLVIGHRGASAQFAENTLEAFRGAADQGADGIELDVRRTLDGAIAVSHDDTTEEGLVVVETPFAGLPGHITDLSSALDVCRPLAVVNIEIKNWPDDKDFDAGERLAEQVVELLTARGELGDGRNLISGFHLPTVDRVHALAPDLATGWLLGFVDDLAPLVDRAAEHGHAAIHPHHVFVNEGLVDRAHAAGLAVNTWTCDDPERIRWLAELGVDAVITNEPGTALEALGR